MISATRRWFRRNRTAIALTAGAVGATYLVGQYIVGKISEARERANLDRIAKENLKRRFEQNQIDCTFTVLALLPTVTENILESLPVEQLTQELQHKKAERLARAGEGAQSELSSNPSSIKDGDTASLSSFQTGSFVHASQLAEDPNQPRSRKSKAHLWNEIKITSITRACTLIYTLSLLTLLTRIQLNLLGRLSYVTSVVTLAQPQPADRANSISLEDHDDSSHVGGSAFGSDFEVNRRYLTFSWHLLNRGYAQILTKVQAAVNETFGSISPTEPLTPARMSDLILSIRKKVEGATEHDRYVTRWLPYLLPPREEEETLLVESGVITPPPSSSANSPPQSNSGNQNTQASYFNTSSGPLRSLLDETADLIDSPTFTRIHTMILNTLFAHLIDTKLAEQAFSPAYRPTGPSQDPSSSVTVVANATEPKVKLATILAVLTRQAHTIGRGNTSPPSPLPATSQQPSAERDPTSAAAAGTAEASPGATSTTNEYLALVDSQVKELEAFAAVIYSHTLRTNPQIMEQIYQAQSQSKQTPPAQSQPPTSMPSQPMPQTSSSKEDPATDVSPEEGTAAESGILEGAWSRIVGGSSDFSSNQ